MMRRIFLAALVASLVLAPSAVAADWSLPNADAAATAVAGHPVHVYCESSWTEWVNYFEPQGTDGTAVNGFTSIASPVVYVSPRQCETLHAVAASEDVGTYYAASALLTLVHESVHQRGISDEGVTDCTALPLVPGVATSFFGVPATVLARQLVRVRSHHRWRLVARSVSVPNPWLLRLAVDALRWHRSKPAAYQGTC